MACEHFRVSGDGHRALEAWARQFGPIARWGIEGASSWGRHTAMFLVGRGHDVRDVCANRTPGHDRARQRGKSDTLDSERIARETLAHPLLPKAFKRAGQDAGPDEQHQLLALWNNRRRSILTRPPASGRTRPSICCASCRWSCASSCPTPRRSARGWRRSRGATAGGATTRRPGCACSCSTATARRSQRWTARRSRSSRSSTALVRQSGSTLGELCGLSTRSVAELLVEVGDPRRFTEGGFARFNGTAPLPASTAEGPGEPIRHRYNPGGNRRVNAILHRMAVTQLRCEPRAQRIYANARANGHTKKEARRILKRHLSDVIYRRMIRDLAAPAPRPAPPRCITARGRRAVKDGPTGPSAASRAAASLDGDRWPRATLSQGGA